MACRVGRGAFSPERAAWGTGSHLLQRTHPGSTCRSQAQSHQTLQASVHQAGASPTAQSCALSPLRLSGQRGPGAASVLPGSREKSVYQALFLPLLAPGPMSAPNWNRHGLPHPWRICSLLPRPLSISPFLCLAQVFVSRGGKTLEYSVPSTPQQFSEGHKEPP